jgi:hypothetical protein
MWQRDNFTSKEKERNKERYVRDKKYEREMRKREKRERKEK